MELTHHILIWSISLLIVGCGVSKRTLNEPQSGNTEPAHRVEPERPSEMIVSKTSEVRASLNQAYRNWKGTPYELGGNSARGIDCSAFMQRVFRRYFGIRLPRTTRRQIHSGRTLSKAQLTTGDLVFFKTGRHTLHVGVMMGTDTFLHASTSAGVTISSIVDYYWKSRYLTARRVIKY